MNVGEHREVREGEVGEWRSARAEVGDDDGIDELKWVGLTHFGFI